MSSETNTFREQKEALFSDAAFDLGTCATKLGCALYVFSGVARNLNKVTLEHEVFEQPPEGEWLNIALTTISTNADTVLAAEAKVAFVAWSRAERIRI